MKKEVTHLNIGQGLSKPLCNCKHTRYFGITYARKIGLVTCKHCLKKIYGKSIRERMKSPDQYDVIPETIEINNETKRTILVTACRSKASGKLFIHIGRAHGTETKVKPLDYAIIEVNEVEM